MLDSIVGGVAALQITLVRFWQLANAELPIEVTELPITKLVRLEQLPNASGLILITELGIVILVSPLQ